MGHKTTHEARLLQLNCDKAHQDLGWQPRWGVEKTFAATAEWYKTIMAGGNVEDIYTYSTTRLFSGVTMIEGVTLTPLRQIFDERGKGHAHATKRFLCIF